MRDFYLASSQNRYYLLCQGITELHNEWNVTERTVGVSAGGLNSTSCIACIFIDININRDINFLRIIFFL